MYYTKSFCNVLAFASNEPGVNSVIGELTPFAKTFTKELGQYHHSTLDGYDLYNFSSLRNSVAIQMRATAVNQAIELVNKVVTTTLGRTGELYADEILAMLMVFSPSINVDSVEVGAMVTDGRYWVPTWISWHDSTDTNDNSHKVWLGIDAFTRQYTDNEIVVVPPFDNVDDFFLPGSLVESRLKAITPSQMMERSELAKGKFPETFRRTEVYAYTDPNNTSRIVDSYWTVLIYGPGGNNPDLIQDAIANYILANSSRPRSDWIKVLPDIFKRNEYVFVPMFDRYASGQRVLSHGIYSPLFTSKELVDYLKNWVPDYSAAHVTNYGQAIGFTYRSLVAAVIGNIENKDAKFKLSDAYPDYMNVPTDDPDLNRMSQDTQEWVMLINELIVLAENWTEASDLPQGVSLVTRAGKKFIARSHKRTLMLVLAKANMPEA